MSIKNDGHYFCRAGGNRPDGLNEPVTAGLLLGEKGELVFTVLGVLLCCETVKVLLRIALDILRGRLEKKELMLFII
ncbi:hypothetical protein HJ823_005127 [Escherichia coli]|nr:hypothetical protein [Escherichia coli]